MIIDEADHFGIAIYYPESISDQMKRRRSAVSGLVSQSELATFTIPGWWESSHVIAMGMQTLSHVQPQYLRGR